jgi:cysteine desulfurase
MPSELIYLDYAASTPVDPRVVAAMLPFFTEHCGNPANTSHAAGQYAARIVHTARTQVAALLGAEPNAIIFTSGATESNNWVFQGLAAQKPKRRKILTTAIEHKSVLCAAEALSQQGFEVQVLPVNTDGILDLAVLEAALDEQTLLVSVMHVNNEVGTLQPVAAIGELCRRHGALFHCDAVQSVGKLPLDLNTLAVDYLALSAHKLYGPKGIGALYCRSGAPALSPLISGGGQEFGMRSGTLNVPGIVGLGVAAELAGTEIASEALRLTSLRNRLYAGLCQEIPGTHLSGSLSERLPGNLHVCFEGLRPGTLGRALPTLAASAGSACSASSAKPSHVLTALGIAPELAQAGLRLTLGRMTTADEIEQAIALIGAAVTKLRSTKGLPF